MLSLLFSNFLLFCSLALMAYWLVSHLQEVFQPTPQNQFYSTTQGGLTEKFVLPLGAYLREKHTERFSAKAQTLLQYIRQAGGYKGVIDGYDVIAMQILGAVCMPVLLWSFIMLTMENNWFAWLAAFFGLWVGCVFPTANLRGMAAQRQKKFFRQFPNALDIFCVCVEAGLDFSTSANYVINCFIAGPVREELQLMQQEFNFGKSQAEALNNISGRINIPEVTTVIGGITQAMEMGTPMAEMLKISAREMRKKRALAAEEEAKKAVVKITMPLLLLIMPGVFIVLLGPIGRELISTFSTMK
ncbi:MAG: type II secretion system F family protein [Lentisphaeria bacterium]|nr:type II secretion system F family protein [Lentisphaeria bacterium]